MHAFLLIILLMIGLSHQSVATGLETLAVNWDTGAISTDINENTIRLFIYTI